MFKQVPVPHFSVGTPELLRNVVFPRIKCSVSKEKYLCASLHLSLYREGQARWCWLSYGCQFKVIININKRNIKLLDFINADRFVCSRIKLLQFKLPLQSLHRIQCCCFVLLPHQKARLV